MNRHEDEMLERLARIEAGMTSGREPDGVIGARVIAERAGWQFEKMSASGKSRLVDTANAVLTAVRIHRGED